MHARADLVNSAADASVRRKKMSITVDYFFNSEMAFEKLADEINHWLGCALAPQEGAAQDLFCRFMALELSLCRHHLENDGDCRFEDYQFEIGMRTPAPDGDLRRIQVEVMSIVAFILYRRLGVHQGMLVFDVQVPLARYQVKDDQSYDVISGRPVEFPEHFVVLHNRIGRDGWR